MEFRVEKLSEETLEAGRDFLRAKDLDGFMAWLDKSRVPVDPAVVRETYEFFFRADAVDKALQMFDKFFPEADVPDEATWKAAKETGAI